MLHKSAVLFFAAMALAGCTTGSSNPTAATQNSALKRSATERQLIANAEKLVATSYQCQGAMGREPHYSAIESSEAVLRSLGHPAAEADSIVRGWLRADISSSKQPDDLDKRTCEDRMLRLAEKVRVGHMALKATRP